MCNIGTRMAKNDHEKKWGEDAVWEMTSKHTAARPCCRSKDLAFQLLQLHIGEVRAHQVGVFRRYRAHGPHGGCGGGSILFLLGFVPLIFCCGILSLGWPAGRGGLGCPSHSTGPRTVPRKRILPSRLWKACSSTEPALCLLRERETWAKTMNWNATKGVYTWEQCAGPAHNFSRVIS